MLSVDDSADAAMFPQITTLFDLDALQRVVMSSFIPTRIAAKVEPRSHPDAREQFWGLTVYDGYLGY